MFRKARLFALAACLTVPLLAPVSTQAEQPDTVTVCHITGSDNDVLFAGGVPSLGISPANWYFGHLIDVNENALDAHLNHGDVVTPRSIPFSNTESGALWTVTELLNLPFGLGTFFVNSIANGQYPNADCATRYPILPS